MSVTYDRLVCDVFEDDDLGRVAESVRGGRADKQVERLEERWRDWASTWVPPDLPLGHLRPFAFNEWSGQDSGGLASTWMTLVTKAESAGEIDRQIIRHLLFCDGVALPDPFFRSLDGVTVVPRWQADNRWDPRESIAAVVETVGRLRDLIRGRILVIVPLQATIRPPVLRAVRETPEVEALFPPHPSDWYGLSHQSIAALDLAAQLATAAGELDPYLPTAGHVAVFHELARAGDAELRAAIKDAAPSPLNKILPEVLRCPLPDPVGLTLEDVVAIRNERHFEGWRDAVAAGVNKFTESVRDDPDGWPNSDKALLDQITIAVRDKAAEAKREIGWMKNPTVEAAISLVLVGGATAAAAAGASPEIAASVAATSALPPLGILWSRYRFRGSGYARHVAVFMNR